MTFIGAAQNVVNVGAIRHDGRLERDDRQFPDAIFVDLDFVTTASFRTLWWGGGIASDMTPVFGADPCCPNHPWARFDQVGPGGSSRFAFVGVTRDSVGAPAGNCSVKLFRTSDDALIDKTVSDLYGNFLLNTPFYPDQHYIVAHKTDSPPINGASVNTLIGS